MLDINMIRKTPHVFQEGFKKRHNQDIVSSILDLDKQHRSNLTIMQGYLERRNAIAKEFPVYKKENKDVSLLQLESEDLKKKIADLEPMIKKQEEDLFDILSTIPNIPSEDCPIGNDETSNTLIRSFGIPKSYDFDPKPHYDLVSSLMSFETASKLSGSRFVILYNALAKLERVLANWMLSVHTEEFGYMEVSPPILLKEDAMFGVGQLPKFKDDVFQTTNGYYLIPTAEACLTNIVANEIIEKEKLPLRFTAYTPCFRSEAGAAGRDTRGMIRQHQFGKVELVSIVDPDKSKEEHERMTNCAEEILKRLELPYRTMLLSTGDMGFCSSKTYDLEVWLPSQKVYREISSCSNCSDFQARRMNARFKNRSKNDFVHTLNGSALAVGRTLIAILENYQDKDGRIEIPKVLKKYMNAEYLEC